MKKILLALLLLCLLIGGIYLYYVPRLPLSYRTDVAELGKSPRWKQLYHFSPQVDAGEFQSLLTRYYAVGDSWQEFFRIEGDEIQIKNASETFTYKMQDAPQGSSRGRYWRRKEEVSGGTADQPLRGLHVALDPGHIGGKCAKLEERWFQIEDNLPVMEGEMTLLVAQHIKPRLEALGAKVSLIRKENEPVGLQRSPHFMALAEKKVEALDRDPALTQRYADKLFYRTAEIRARARKVNKTIKPDLVVALHFNAEGWGDPARPTLTHSNHFHILLNGAYTSGELAHEDERFELSQKILQGTILEEIALSESFVKAFKRETGLPPFQYEPNSKRAIKVDEEGYIWTRNLLANRLYECPTIFLEPYIMNSHEVHARVQLGDYEGEVELNGTLRKSLFREYADAVTLALKEYYQD